jgi:hypothetical protein
MPRPEWLQSIFMPCRPRQHAIAHSCGPHAYPRATSANGTASSATIKLATCIRRIIFVHILPRFAHPPNLIRPLRIDWIASVLMLCLSGALADSHVLRKDFPDLFQTGFTSLQILLGVELCLFSIRRNCTLK